jgi:Zn-dependent oligopeptidase
MPDEIIDKIIKSQFINQGLFNLRQLYFGKFDLTVHGQGSDSSSRCLRHFLVVVPRLMVSAYTELDYTKLWNDLREQVGNLFFSRSFQI